ncbi:MAG: DegT/DnrJ/EryC1/StrS family aminotransferase [Lachnospiraceae bacterium]|nr:DegT/DnrJ/EryC1/StrS family aminotransferase [Lachnospiraceae bacterium]
MKNRLEKPIYVTRPSMPDYEEYIEQIRPLWDSHVLTNMAEYHGRLERELSRYLQVDRLSLVTNGHMALELALQALGLSGEVITTPFTFISTTHAIVRNNLTPVFCDIDGRDFTMDVTKLEALIGKKTCAIVPVHVYGRVCQVEKIEEIARKHGLKVIYDAAHAFGVTYKGKPAVSYGDMSTLSFHATKVFNTVEGGAVVYHDDEVGSELYSLKNFGIRSEECTDGVGANAKMDELRAIMGLCNLRNVEADIVKRKALFETYMECLEGIAGLSLPFVQKDVKANYAYFPVLFDEGVLGIGRDAVYEELKKRNIYARKYFYPLANAAQCYRNVYSSSATPVAERVAVSVLTLPMYADLERREVVLICENIREIIGRGGKI